MEAIYSLPIKVKPCKLALPIELPSSTPLVGIAIETVAQDFQQDKPDTGLPPTSIFALPQDKSSKFHSLPIPAMSTIPTLIPMGHCSETVSTELWGIDRSLNLAQLASDFYLIQDAKVDFPDDTNIKYFEQTLTDLLGEQFSLYLDMAIGGELRHAVDKSSLFHESSSDKCDDCEYERYDRRRDEYHKPCDNGSCPSGHYEGGKVLIDSPCWMGKPQAKALVEQLKDRGTSHSSGRSAMWYDWLKLRKKGGVELLKRTSEIFRQCKWDSAYGGESWAVATDTLISYLEGNITPVTFIDTAFGIHHNGGIVFDKVWDTKELVNVLNANQRGYLTTLMYEASPEIHQLRRKLYGERGIKQNE